MSLHVFGSILTGYGVAANNRGETEGNITTLQKLLWKDEVHTTVSAEAIRWAIRYYWQQQGREVNRKWDDDKEDHIWQDPSWEAWAGSSSDGKIYIDDDVLGFMKAEAAKSEGEEEGKEQAEEEGEKEKKKGKSRPKGKVDKRRGVLEIARAISLTPFAGDITFNAKSGEKDRTSLYGTECHATRYQYGFAMTPARLKKQEHAIAVLDAIVNLGEVAGNHSRFLFDFSPDYIILRITQDPAPRILYCFEQDERGNIGIPSLLERLKNGDIDASELYVGGSLSDSTQKIKAFSGSNTYDGVKKAVEACKKKLSSLLPGGTVP